jgi:peptide/nickel transport system substrate-binding protein
VLVVSALGLSAAAACTAEPTPPASGDPAGTSLVIALAHEPASLNPLAGYAEHGAAKIFDGLLEHRANSTLRPALAAELPEPAPDGRSWTVALRAGVTFSDGTAFDATDVVATYHALLDPAYASPVRQRFTMLKAVHQVDATTVRFELTQPYLPFPQLLVLGILPSEVLANPRSVDDTKLVGTGPYKVVEWRRGERMVLSANQSYWDGPPAVSTVTVQFIADDDARANRMREGKLDGAALPPRIASTFEGTEGLAVVTHNAASVNTVTLPTGNPVTEDPAIRLALNHALNRRLIVDTVLASKGTEASTPVPDALAEFVEPAARYTYDVTKALDVLGEAGWAPGSDGLRTRNGVVAKFTLLYLGGDTLSRDLADAFATAARGIGVQVSTEPADETLILTRSATTAVLLAFGNPFDPDLRLYRMLHSTMSGEVDANPGRYANPTVDAALDSGRSATDPAARATAYRKLQRAFLTAPGMVVLAAPAHTYVMRQSWHGYQPVVEGEDAGVTWGPWWNLHKWTPR